MNNVQLSKEKLRLEEEIFELLKQSNEMWSAYHRLLSELDCAREKCALLHSNPEAYFARKQEEAMQREHVLQVMNKFLSRRSTTLPVKISQ